MGCVETFAYSLYSRELPDTNVKGLPWVSGSPDVIVVFEPGEDLVDIHGAVVSPQDIENGGRKRSGRRDGAFFPSDRSGAYSWLA